IPASRLTRYTCSATSRPIPREWTPRRARLTTVSRWHSPNPAACVLWSPIATSVSAPSTGDSASGDRRASTSPWQSRCTARWRWASGSSKPARRTPDENRCEDEILALLREPIPMRLGMVDGKGWPIVIHVWAVFVRGVFRMAAGTTAHKANVLRANERAYFTVDTGGNYGDSRGVRGPATVQIASP